MRPILFAGFVALMIAATVPADGARAADAVPQPYGLMTIPLDLPARFVPGDPLVAIAASFEQDWSPEPPPPPPPEPEPPQPVRYVPPPRTGWLHAWITDEILYELRMCESTDNYSIDTGNSFAGAVQWLQSTWNAAAARAGRHDLIGVRPNHVAPADQDYITKVWWSVSDYRGQWPVCGPRAVARAG